MCPFSFLCWRRNQICQGFYDYFGILQFLEHWEICQLANDTELYPDYFLIIFVLSISLYMFLLCVWYKWNHSYIALYFICFQTSDDSSSELNLFKMALREAYNRELEFYETQEAQIMKQIAALENDRSHLRERKRSHIQCLVNVIACYRKK